MSWADERAREWLVEWAASVDEPWIASLAALLREVAAPKEGAAHLIRAEVLAEVRRVVEEVQGNGLWGLRDEACREILRRLEKL